VYFIVPFDFVDSEKIATKDLNMSSKLMSSKLDVPQSKFKSNNHSLSQADRYLKGIMTIIVGSVWHTFGFGEGDGSN